MNTLPLHPAIVHVPLGLTAVMPAVLLLLLAASLRNRLPRGAWLVGLALQTVVFAGALVALRSGEQDEERVEARVGEAALEAHERAARTFTWVAGATLGATGLAFVLRRRPRGYAGAGAASVALSVLALILAIQVGHRGGALVHGPGAPGAGVEVGADPAPDAASAEETDEDDD